MLEALYASAFGKSFRTGKKGEMVQWQSAGWSTSLNVSGPAGNHRIASGDSGRFQRSLDGKAIHLTELVPHFFPIFFSTLSSVSVLESPAALRGFFDRLAVGLTPLYLPSLLRYNAALRQKNSLLKRTSRREELSSWNRILADMGLNVMAARSWFVSQLNGALNARESAALTVDYRPDLTETDAESFFRSLEALAGAECESRICLRGPHRDRFRAERQHLPLAVFSSGEKRRALLEIVLGYVDLYAERHGQPPILLLDDYDAALDERAIDGVFARLPRVQVVATSVHPSGRFDCRIELPKEN